MGAVAWGDGDRLTNPYYRPLRQIFHFGPEGQVRVNRMLANWHNGGERDPYTQLLREIIGDPIPPEKMWNPDAVLRVEEAKHAVARASESIWPRRRNWFSRMRCFTSSII